MEEKKKRGGLQRRRSIVDEFSKMRMAKCPLNLGNMKGCKNGFC